MAYSLFLTAVDVSFSETAVTVVEGDGRITLRLSVTGQLDSSVSVDLQVWSQDGTATGESELSQLDSLIKHQLLAVIVIQHCWSIKAVLFSPSAPGDYSPSTGILTLNSSTMMLGITVAISDDAVIENDEQFSVVLNSSNTDVRTSVNRAVVTITDNDRGVYTLNTG